MENSYSKEFEKILRDFCKDVVRTFPECKDSLGDELKDLMDNKKEVNLSKTYEFCAKVYPPLFVDILYQKEELFENKIELLPNIDFSILWKQDVTKHTREIMWKYLQLVLMSVVKKNKNIDFQGKDNEDFKEKISETLENMQDFFKDNEKSDKSGFSENMENLVGGSIGSLAKEIAEEAVGDLNLDSENSDDIIKTMFSKPGNLMSLVNKITSKIDTKVKSGSLNEEELQNEAFGMMGQLKNMPGFDKMFSNMQKNTANVKNPHNNMSNPTAERLRKKLNKRKKNKNK